MPSPMLRRAAEIGGWGLLCFMAVWIGSIPAYDYWVVTTGTAQPDPSTLHIVREHSAYITPSQQSVLLMPILVGWIVSGFGFLCLRLAGYAVFKQDATNYVMGAVAIAISAAASYNPYAANVASLLGSGHWTLSP